MRQRRPDAVLVTSAPKSPAEEIRDRQRRYLWTMGFRTAAFVLSIVLFANHWPAVGALTLAAAFVLPWVAVVVANAGPRHQAESPALYEGQRPTALGSGQEPPDRR